MDERHGIALTTNTLAYGSKPTSIRRMPSVSQSLMNLETDADSTYSDLAHSFSKNFLFNLRGENRFKKGGLGREYWLKDSSATKCFACEKYFNAFRRKHHCRICGQIFCSKCTVFIAGEDFEVDGKLRVCKSCLSYADQLEESSDECATEDLSKADSASVDNKSVENDIHTPDTRSEGLGPNDEEDNEQSISLYAAASMKKGESRFDASNRSSARAHASMIRMKHQKKPHFTITPSDDAFKSWNFPESQTHHQKRIFSIPSKDLSASCEKHCKALALQLLEEKGIPNIDKWVPMLLRCLKEMSIVTPDTRHGDAMNIRQYVKLKRIPGGFPSCFYLDGLVFPMNLAFKTMPREISSPKIALIMFPIEFNKTKQHLMSLELVLKQESEYLVKLVGRIIALKPDIVLVGASISGLALDLLSQAGIAVAFNLKPQIMERLARLTNADVVSSIDKLAVSPRLGSCDLFEAKTFAYKNYKRNYFFFTGCQPELGGTIVIRGEEDELEKIKTTLEFLVYVKFNLKLEIALLKDEYLQTFLNTSKIDTFEWDSEDNLFLDRYNSTILSSSPGVQFPLPVLFSKLRDLKLGLLKAEQELVEYRKSGSEEVVRKYFERFHFTHSKLPEIVTFKITECFIQNCIQSIRANYTLQRRQWDLFYLHSTLLLDRANHQNIVFLYSMASSRNATPCIGPETLEIDFYWDNDMSLGQYVQHLASSAYTMCPEDCGLPLMEHERLYVHGDSQLTVTAKPSTVKISIGLDHVIVTWSKCRVCQRTTPIIPLSSSSYNYSFGKYLELSFWSRFTHVIGSCPHDFYTDHVRFFRLNGVLVQIEPSKVQCLEVVVPRLKVMGRPQVDIRLKIETYHDVVKKINDFFHSIHERLDRVKIDASMGLEKVELGQEKIETLKKKATEEGGRMEKLAREIYDTSIATEHLSLNGVLREIQELSVSWDSSFQKFETDFLPSENDITRITASQLRKLFKEKEEEMVEMKELSVGEKQELEEQLKDGLEERLDQPPARSKVREKASLIEAKLQHGEGQRSLSNGSHMDENKGKVKQLTSLFDQLHLDQISMEFELEREKERRKMAANRYRAVPVTASKPIVEVYKNVQDAVDDEREPAPTHAVVHEPAVVREPEAVHRPEESGGGTTSEEAAPPSSSSGLSLIKTLTKFWADRSATLWEPLEYPLTSSEHIFVDSNVVVREDEPSSLVAFCLSSSDYRSKIVGMRTDASLEEIMLKKTAIHLKYQFQEGNSTLACKIFFAEQFDAFRQVCECEDHFVQSLSRCVKWDSSGGKSGSAFLKTLDDRFVIKQLSSSELDTFVKFAPSYFEYFAQALFHDLPTAIAKIFGFYQIQIKNSITGKNFRMDVLIMENVFYNHTTSRIFDLKGSMRNRHVQQTGKENEVLLDENMVEYIYESPLFVKEHAKKLLRASLWNDTLFLAKMNVMDYSLVVGIDNEHNQLIVGIIDCIRTFTWDKKLESWVKEKGLVGGGGKEPTVVTPRQYKNRFRLAMERYILMVPDCWYQRSL